MDKSKKLAYFIPSFIWMVIIFTFSNQPGESSNKIIFCSRCVNKRKDRFV